MVVRRATGEGTTRFMTRLVNKLPASHFRYRHGLWFSSIGMSIHLRGEGAGDEKGCDEALIAALERGCNYIDTSVTYRSKNTEKRVGQALVRAFAKGSVARDEVILSARGGHVLFGGDYPADAAEYVQNHLIDAGVAAADEFAQGWHHCISPKFLRTQFRRCLDNLNLGELDIFFIENPDIQQFERGTQVFEHRLRAAFAELEAHVDAERLAFFGVTSVDGFRVPPTDPAHLSLERILELAQDAGGSDHRFRFIQAPINLAMQEMLLHKNQVVKGRRMTALEAAEELGLSVIGSTSLWHGQLVDNLPLGVRTGYPEASTDAQAAIQFARSVPGITSALVGMLRREEVIEDLAIAASPPAKWTVTEPADQQQNKQQIDKNEQGLF